MRHALPLAALAVLVAGCMSTHPRVHPEPTPVFQPEVFFAGETTGLGTLAIRGRGTQLVRVRSHGEALPDGGFRLEQTIQIGDDAPRERVWTLTRTASGYVSTLTDADGPVTVEVDGSALRIRYPMGGGLTMHQSLYLEPGGQTAFNLATVRFLSLPIARLSEQIRRVPPAE